MRFQQSIAAFASSLLLGTVLLSGGVVDSFSRTSNQPIPGIFPSRRSMTEQQEDSLPSPVVPAQVALKSSKLARSIRHYRQIRGRTDSAVHPDVETHNVSAHTEIGETKEKPTGKEGVLQSRKRSGSDLPFDSTMTALRAYHSIHGDLVIPRRFTVPSDDLFPKEWHTVDLSSTVYCLRWWQRNIKEKPDRVAELNKLGFVWERLQPEWNLVLEALITYSVMHGDVLVPNKFMVPHDNSEWPKATWGITLGNCVYRIRARNDFLRGNNAVTRRNQLNGLGFVWDVHEHSFRLFYTALRHFAKLEGCGAYSLGRTKALRVPSTFVVPNSDDWPKELWGFQIGAKCTAVRQKDLYVKNKPDRQQALVELGFRWSGNADLGWLEVVHAAAIYSRMHNRTLDVPYHFVVPVPPNLGGQFALSNGVDWPWPEHLWGLPLGQRLKDVRIRGAYLSNDTKNERRRQLDALGFNWTPKRGRRKVNPQ